MLTTFPQPTQLITGISRNTQSRSYMLSIDKTHLSLCVLSMMLSLTDCVFEFQSNALWDTH